MIGLDSYSRQVFIYLNFAKFWLSLPGDYRVTDEALLAETT